MITRKVLITGATGLLGRYLMDSAPSWAEAIGAGYTRPADLRLNLLDRVSVLEALDATCPEIVIHCAGEGRVDFAEQRPAEARELNIDGLKNLLWASKVWQAQFVYISSNAVYGGERAPYTEADEHKPVNRYGRMKAEAEIFVRDYPHLWTIFRPILLYGFPAALGRGNMVTRLIDDLTIGEKVSVADDIYSQPTYAYDCAAAIWKALGKHYCPDSLNIAPARKMTLWEFAREVAKVFDLDPELVVPVKSADLKNMAPRPKDTTFDTRALNRMGISVPDPHDALRRMKKELPPI